jgi:hypothetical protein
LEMGEMSWRTHTQWSVSGDVSGRELRNPRQCGANFPGPRHRQTNGDNKDDFSCTVYKIRLFWCGKVGINKSQRNASSSCLNQESCAIMTITPLSSTRPNRNITEPGQAARNKHGKEKQKHEQDM